MKVPIRADIHYDLETDVRVFKCAPDFLPPRGALQEVSLEYFTFCGFLETPGAAERLIPTALGLLKKDAGQDLRFGLRIVLDHADLRLPAGLDRKIAYELAHRNVSLIQIPLIVAGLLVGNPQQQRRNF